MSLARLTIAPRVLRTYDADASAYIAAVEFADGQALEQPIRTAITEFVVGCKTAGIWSAIQSCCLLCGARTLSGALVPLKGPAPTNFNSLFTNSDYNRETGLKGNGSSKYLDTNFNATSLPQDNFHFSLYISSLSSVGAQRTYMADTGGRNMYRPISNNTLTQFNINASFGAAQGDLDMASSTGFCGLSRDNASNFTIRIGSRNRVVSANSVSGDGGTMRIFGRNGNGVMGEFSDSRIAFYSVGESLNLKLLNDVVTNYMNALYRYFYPSSLDSEASLWISSAERSGRLRVNATTASAVNAFCNAINSAGIRDKFYRLNLFCGPNLTSCLIPLYRGTSAAGTQYGNTTDQSTNFSSISDYTEYGLLGNGSSKSLETGLLTSTINSLYPNVHLAVYGNNTPTTGAGTFIQTGDGGSYYTIVGDFGFPSFINMIAGNHVSGGAVYQTINSNLGMNIINRTSTTLVRLYRNGSYVNQSTATQNSPPGLGTWTSQTFRLFASRVQDNGPGNHTNLRACGYSIGSSMTESQLTDYRNAMQTFQTTLQRQV